MTSDAQRCVDRIGEAAGLPVSLTDVDLNSLLFSPHQEHAIDDVRRDSLLLRSTAPWVREWFTEYGVGATTKPVRVEPHAEHATMSRVVLPVIHRGLRLGLLCILDPDYACTARSLAELGPLVDELALLLYDEENDRVHESRMVLDLLTGSLVARSRAADELATVTASGPDAAGGVETLWTAVTVGTLSGPPKHDETRPDPPGSRGGATAATHETATVLQCATTMHHALLFPGEGPDARQVRRLLRIAHVCCRSPVVGIGEPFPLLEAATSYAQAKAAMSAAARLDDLPSPARFDDLGALRQLATRSDADLVAGIDRHTRALLDLADDELLTTLLAYLDCGCDTAATTARLSVHRGTLYYRLRKAESVTGLDLSRGPGRLTLYVGLTAHRLIDSPRRPGHATPVRLLPW